jgi:hypothetical protein
MAVCAVGVVQCLIEAYEFCMTLGAEDMTVTECAPWIETVLKICLGAGQVAELAIDTTEDQGSVRRSR